MKRDPFTLEEWHDIRAGARSGSPLNRAVVAEFDARANAVLADLTSETTTAERLRYLQGVYNANICAKRIYEDLARRADRALNPRSKEDRDA